TPLVEEGIGVSVSMMAFWLAGSSLSRFALPDVSFNAYFEAFGFSLFAIFWHLEGIYLSPGSRAR
ncbi:hypothetical protein C8J56DRAFT_929253, partial [Mycena floridula]